MKKLNHQGNAKMSQDEEKTAEQKEYEETQKIIKSHHEMNDSLDADKL